MISCILLCKYFLSDSSFPCSYSQYLHTNKNQLKKQKSQRGKYKENFTNYLINNPLRIQQVSVKFQQDWRKYDIKMNSENCVV